MVWRDFALAFGQHQDNITVLGTPRCNTSDALVSTLIGNRFVDNMPLKRLTFSPLSIWRRGSADPKNAHDQCPFSV